MRDRKSKNFSHMRKQHPKILSKEMQVTGRVINIPSKNTSVGR